MPENVRQIEWQHMTKWKYFLYNSGFILSVDCVLHPAWVIRTRLQVQRTRSVYKNTLDAITKTAKHEGFRGLYRGFLVGQISILSGNIYVSTYETSRAQFTILGDASRGFMAGFLAAVVEQCFANPMQVVSQRVMLEGHQNPSKSKIRGSTAIAKDVLKTHGAKGLYRGFLASLLSMGVDSAIWWGSYGMYLNVLGEYVPDGTSHILVQGTAGALSGFNTAIIGNPLEIIRTRIQVEGRGSIRKVFLDLLKKEGPLALLKGVIPNVVLAVPSSVLLICGYEMVKKHSLKNEVVELYI